MAVIPILLTACTSTKSGSDNAGSSSGKVKIGLITKTDSNPYFVSMRDAAQKEADKQGAQLIATAGTADGDNDSQVTAVENMIASGVKAILITPNDSKAIVPTLLAAQQKGIFVAALDTQTDGNKGVDATWATDNTKAGQQQGAYVKAALAGKTPVLAMLDLQPGVSVGDQRHNGFLDRPRHHRQQPGHRRQAGHQRRPGQGSDRDGEPAAEEPATSTPSTRSTSRPRSARTRR